MEQEVLNIAHMISHVENQDQEAPALLTNYEEPFVAPPRPPRPPPPGPHMHHLETVRYEDFTFWHFVMPFWKNFTRALHVMHFSFFHVFPWFFNSTNFYKFPQFQWLNLVPFLQVYRSVSRRTSWWASRFGSTARPREVWWDFPKHPFLFRLGEIAHQLFFCSWFNWYFTYAKIRFIANLKKKSLESFNLLTCTGVDDVLWSMKDLKSTLIDEGIDHEMIVQVSRSLRLPHFRMRWSSLQFHCNIPKLQRTA